MSNKYCSGNCEIFISKKDIPALMKNLINASREFNHGNTKRDLSNMRGVSAMFDWSVSFDAEGNINHILAYNELSWGMSCRERFVEVIAPFVKDGGYVEMHGEDDDLFRIVFEEGTMREIRPSVSW